MRQKYISVSPAKANSPSQQNTRTFLPSLTSALNHTAHDEAAICPLSVATQHGRSHIFFDVSGNTSAAQSLNRPSRHRLCFPHLCFHSREHSSGAPLPLSRLLFAVCKWAALFSASQSLSYSRHRPALASVEGIVSPTRTPLFRCDRSNSGWFWRDGCPPCYYSCWVAIRIPRSLIS